MGLARRRALTCESPGLPFHGPKGRVPPRAIALESLYRVLWRTAREGQDTLRDVGNEDVIALERMADAVRKDVGRIHALVRFRHLLVDGGEELYAAFHRPVHRALALAAPFFVTRFAPMRWSILTPDASAHWDRRALCNRSAGDVDWGLGRPRGANASLVARAGWPRRR